MEILLSFKEAVYLKGNETQIEKFQKDGKLYRTQEKAIITRFEEEYEKVEVIGRGKNKGVLLKDKRSVPKKMDKRQNNKATGRKTPFANQLDLLIVKALRDSENGNIEGSVGNVMSEMNMANERLCYYRQPNRIEKYIAELKRMKSVLQKIGCLMSWTKNTMF